MKPSYFLKICPHHVAEVDLLPFPDGTWWVSRVIVPEPHRGQGHGYILMTDVCAEADKEQVTLVLSAEPYPNTMTREKLMAWYEEFGFESEPMTPEGIEVAGRMVRTHLEFE